MFQEYAMQQAHVMSVPLWRETALGLQAL